MPDNETAMRNNLDKLAACIEEDTLATMQADIALMKADLAAIRAILES